MQFMKRHYDMRHLRTLIFFSLFSNLMPSSKMEMTCFFLTQDKVTILCMMCCCYFFRDFVFLQSKINSFLFLLLFCFLFVFSWLLLFFYQGNSCHQPCLFCLQLFAHVPFLKMKISQNKLVALMHSLHEICHPECQFFLHLQLLFQLMPRCRISYLKFVFKKREEDVHDVHGLNLFILWCRAKPAAELGIWGWRARLGHGCPTAAHCSTMEVPHPHHSGPLLQTVPAARAEQPGWQWQSACPQALLLWSMYLLLFPLDIFFLVGVGGVRGWEVFMGDYSFSFRKNRHDCFVIICSWMC